MFQGLVFNIQRFCLHDGPGIRSILFIKGCPLRCKWCSNPESQSFDRELIYKEITCMRCGTCVINCPNQVFTLSNNELIIERSKCTKCGICTKTCGTNSLEICGDEISIESITEELLKDRLFYESSHGGITLSGGEPLATLNFSMNILSRIKREGIHTAVETTGYVKREDILSIARLVDLFLYDIKHFSSEIHAKYTGKTNELILENLKALVLEGANIVIRYPFIPGFNSDLKSLSMVVELMKELDLSKIDIMPYHRLGSEKYKNLGRVYELSNIKPPEKSELLKVKDYFLAGGINQVNIY